VSASSNTTGAALMLQKAAQEGIICGLDWFMAIHHRRLRSYAFMPSLAGQQSVMPQFSLSPNMRASIVKHDALIVTIQPTCTKTRY